MLPLAVGGFVRVYSYFKEDLVGSGGRIQHVAHMFWPMIMVRLKGDMGSVDEAKLVFVASASKTQSSYGLQIPARYAASLDCLGGVAASEGLGGLAGCEAGLAPFSSAFGRFSLARYAASRDCLFGVRGSCNLLLLGCSIVCVISRDSCAGVPPIPSTFGRFSSLARNAASRDCFFGLSGLGVVSPLDSSILFSFSCGSSTGD